MLRELPPRHFADATVPLRPDGTPLTHTKSDDDFRIYVAWLADYLVTADLPLHPRQLAYAAITDSQSPDTAAFRISDNYGYAEWELGFLDQHIADGGSWEEWNALEREDWEQRDPEVWADTTFEESCLDRATYERIEEEWIEEQRFGTAIDHADIPYRALLARILRRVPARAERIRMLEFYFRNFSENAAK